MAETCNMLGQNKQNLFLNILMYLESLVLNLRVLVCHKHIMLSMKNCMKSNVFRCFKHNDSYKSVQKKKTLLKHIIMFNKNANIWSANLKANNKIEYNGSWHNDFLL